MTLQTEGASPPASAAAATEPIWFASYPPGDSARRIDPDSLSRRFRRCCSMPARGTPRIPAFECLGTRMTYAEWERVSRAFAAFLVEEAHAGPAIASRSCCRTCSPIR